MANWTNAQISAIETHNKTLLVSAAAGSGKTTVLIERIIRSLTDPEKPADISRMLIVTFTRAAAAELRQRISAALSKAIAERPDDKRLFKQLTSLGSAHISTIDSFYSDVVRRNSEKLDIPLSLRIAANEELTPIKRAVMDKVIGLGYDGLLSCSADEFAQMTEMLCDMRNDSSLADVFIDLYVKLSSHPKFIDFLEDAASFYDTATECEFFDSPIGSVLRDHIVSQLEFCEAIMAEVCEFFSASGFGGGACLPPFAADLKFCRDTKAMAEKGGYADVKEAICAYEPRRLVPVAAEDKTPEYEYYIGLRNTVKEKIDNLKKAYFSLSFSNDDMKRIAATSAHRIRLIHLLLSEFDRIYSEEKLTRGICEFVDVKLRAYKLLVNPDGTPTELAAEISESFDSIYIDEYQDVDMIQDMIFRAVAKPRSRFMVGDIKQSIYGFRGAEPSLFMNYRERFPLISRAPDADECTVFMSDNFRCDESIIKFTNLVCSHLFKVGGREISYTDDDDLGFSKITPEGYTGTPAKIVLIDTKKDKDDPNTYPNAEGEYIANEIIRLVNGEHKANGEKITFADIAVLCRSATFGAKAAEALDRRGIPHTFGSSENIFDLPEVSLTVSLLRVIDNPRRDIPLAAVLISPFFGFTAEEIIEIDGFCEAESISTLFDRICFYASASDSPLSEKCKKSISDINTLRLEAESLPADRIIRQIIATYPLLSGCDEGTSSALTKLYENARSYEGDKFKGLYGYLRYLDDMLDSGNTITSESAVSENAVKLITIHNSKGLEFPVCFVGGTYSPFNHDDTKNFLLYSQTLGLAMDLRDESGFGKLRTPYRAAFSREIDNRLAEEEMRILYVALTRARERLYVTASLRFGIENDLVKARYRKSVGTRASVLDSNNYISWILTATYGEDSKHFEIESISAARVFEEISEIVNTAKESSSDIPVFSADELEDAKKQIEDIFSYSYPYLHISNLPAKLSVSKLSPGVLDRNEDSAENADPSSLDFTLPELIRMPAFMAKSDKISAAQKGTDTHTYLQFCNFDNVVESGAKNELDRLIRDGFIEKRAERSVDLKQIEAFFASPLFKRLRNARSVRREQRFNILLPASRFTEDKQYAAEIAGESLLVQGVIDLVFECENGNLVLCDYKTDHLTSAELSDRSLAERKLTDAHRRQLSYYSTAVKLLFGRAPDEVLIYSLPLGDTVAVIPEDIDIPAQIGKSKK